jgi:hypothetical protein
VTYRTVFVIGTLALATAMCGGNSTPTQPTGPGTSGGTTTPPVTVPNSVPTLDAPAADAQLDNLRPTLSVKNGTSSQIGAKTYEFQLSDRSDFGANSGGVSAYYAVAATKTGIAEGSSTTSVAIDTDLQPATRFYWRSRWVQGSTNGDWSATYTFRTQIVGYNRANELYDPLVNGATVAELRFKRTTFIAGKGLRVDDSDSYVRYRLGQTITNGEFSLDIEGISNSPVSENSDTGKLKILSMHDSIFDHYQSSYLMNVQYRGFNGNPPHAISFKMLLGEDDDEHKLEPALGERQASIRALNSANTYHWKATWGGGIRVQVFDGGAGGVNNSGSGIGGNQVYDFTRNSPFLYAPTPHYAYLGVNNSGSETGSWPLATYRNVWIANKSRPTSLGSAMTPLR